MKRFILLCCLVAVFNGHSQGRLKYVVYDFDGLAIGSNDLPDGDYYHNDLNYSIAGNPLQASDVLGDRVLKLDLNWQSGVGDFGKAAMRFIDLDRNADKLNFYFYNPTSNSADAQVQVVITEDDNNNNIYEDVSDDKWIYNVTLARSSEWQLISLPLSSFMDGNTGGNGSFDAKYGSPGGMLFSVGFVFSKPPAAAGAANYYIDMICFSEGNLPVGGGILDLPQTPSEAHCALGALSSGSPQTVPGQIEGFLPSGKKLAFVNWFTYYAASGTLANSLTGNEVQELINNGYTPIITWESMFAERIRLDPVQPRLDQITNGSFDQYITDFANKIKSYNGTVILRILHEFEGDWYSWSLTQNSSDPAKYIAAFRHIVDKFRAAGANNVKWMWCLNAEPKPYVAYNYVVSAYPGDAYVDIVATDIYNHPDLGAPAWKSFRYTMAESYYYLSKYYSHKPIYVCEVGSRERDNGEAPGSQDKAAWTCMMAKDLKSYFNLTRALVFFSMQKEHDWRINSSESARQAFINCLWNDTYFGGSAPVKEPDKKQMAFQAYPNPFIDQLNITTTAMPDTGSLVQLSLYDISGKNIFRYSARNINTTIDVGRQLPPGLYIVELKNGSYVQRQKMVRAAR